MDIPVLPASDIYGPDARALQRFRRLDATLGKHLGGAIALGVPVAAALVFLFAVSISACGAGCGFLSALVLVPLAYLALVLFVLAIAMKRSRRFLRGARRELAITSAMRLQSLKDWYVRGDIEEREYESLRKKVASTTDDTAPHVQAQDASAFYRRAVPAFIGTLVPGVVLFFLSFLALTDGEIVAVPFALVSLVGAVGNGWAIYYALRHGRSLARTAQELSQAALGAIEDEEQALLRNANHRKTGVAPAIVPPRASFKPFSGR